MKLTSRTMAWVLPVILFGGILLSQVTGVWSSDTEKKPNRFEDGLFEGEYDPADIRGSYTLMDVSTLFEIDLNLLIQAFTLNNDIDAENFQTNDLEAYFTDSGYEIGNESVQVFVALYKGLPIVLDDAVLPTAAVDILLQSRTDLTDEQRTYLEEYGKDVVASENPSEEEEEESEIKINGTTTFQYVIDLGVSQEEIEEILGMKVEYTNQTIKDFCLDQGLSFSTIKTRLTEAIETSK